MEPDLVRSIGVGAVGIDSCRSPRTLAANTAALLGCLSFIIIE